MRELEELLKLNKEVSYYQINTVKRESSQLFFVHKDLETVRFSDTFEKKASIYVLHDDKIGDSEFTVYASNTEEEILQKIENAVSKAKLIFNEVFTLPKQELQSYKSNSNLEKYSLTEIAKMTADAVYEADCYKEGSLNAVEVFVTKSTIRVLNSNGLDKKEIKYDCMVEAIPTWNNGESVELYEQYHFNEFNAKKITEEIDDKMNAVHARSLAVKPSDIKDVQIIFRPQEVASIVEALARDLNYQMQYTHSNKYTVGDNYQENREGDPLTVTLVGKIKGATESSEFDRSGTTLRDTVIIENGVAVSRFGGNQYGQYLKEEPTGALRCCVVGAGPKSEDEIRKQPYLECVSMSGIQLDLFSDYIGGEVRLGYYFDGNKVTPVTGISVAGSLTEALNHMHLSNEVTQDGAYMGPKIVSFDGLKVI